MIGRIIEILSIFTIGVIARLGYGGIIVLMGIESACIPLPSEIIMPFAGALINPEIAAHYGRQPFSLFWAATAGAIGCNLGSVLAYEVGYFGGRPLVERWGKYILLNERDLNIAHKFFHKHGGITVLISRMLPVIRTFIALPAGIGKMPRVPFHLYTFIGSWPWCYGLAYVGMKLGEQWNKDPRLKMWFHRFDAVIGLIILAGVVFFVWSHWKHRVKGAEVEEKADAEIRR
jgi:membrane protein DedA with SNARE-associated domain